MPEGPPDAPARIVLREEVTREELYSARALNGWHLANILPASHERPFQIIFLTADEREVLIYVEDPEAEVHYVSVRGDVAHCAREVRASLPAYAEKELLAALGGKADRVRVLRRAAVGLTSARRPELAAAVRAALEHRDPELRLAALWAAQFAGLGELRAAVHRIGIRDPQPDLRAVARSVEERLR